MSKFASKENEMVEVEWGDFEPFVAPPKTPLADELRKRLSAITKFRGQPRDGKGRWSSGGGGGAHVTGLKLKRGAKKAWAWDPVSTSTKMSKLEQGELGERIVLQYLQDKGGTDARPLNTSAKNYPVDMVQNHAVIEVKTGLVSTGAKSQRWRSSIGETSKEEKAWLTTIDAKTKKRYNLDKDAAILERKEAVRREASTHFGTEVRAETWALIVNPDTKTADLYRYDGFHKFIGWRNKQTPSHYVESVTYAEE